LIDQLEQLFLENRDLRIRALASNEPETARLLRHRRRCVARAADADPHDHRRARIRAALEHALDHEPLDRPDPVGRLEHAEE
jgi:hypothetical protein